MKKVLSKELQEEMANKTYQLTAEYVDNVLDNVVEVIGKVFTITDAKDLAEIKKIIKENDLQLVDSIYTKLMGDLDEGVVELEPKENLLKIIRNKNV